jgi:hypothetical protein
MPAYKAAVFDVANKFHGCIPGMHYVLMKQGLAMLTNLVAYFNGKLLLKIWKKHMPDEEAPEEQAGEE